MILQPSRSTRTDTLFPYTTLFRSTPVTDTRTLPATKPQPSRWVQTDRASHEAWARLRASNPKAGALLHLLAARVGDTNAVVVSHKTLAELRSDERRVGKEWVSKCRSRGWALL